MAMRHSRRRVLWASRAAAPGGGAAPFVANAVNFDGTNDHLIKTPGLSGVVNGKKGTLSLWLNRGRSSVSTERIYNQSSTVRGISLRIAPNNTLVISGDNFNESAFFAVPTAITKTQLSGWFHYLASWDLGAGGGPVIQVYVDDTDVAGTPIGTMTEDINYTTGNDTVGAEASPGVTNRYLGDISELWADFSTFIDLTLIENRRKFISAGGKPVNLGSSGEQPTGVAPHAYLSGPTVSWHTNKGTGDGFTEVGALSDAASSPSD